MPLPHPHINTKLKNDEIGCMKKNCPMHATASLLPITSFYRDTFPSHLVASVCWRYTTHHSPFFFVFSLFAPLPLFLLHFSEDAASRARDYLVCNGSELQVQV
jgi:hypothetical protein